jgi:aminoglycoside 6'-N-acetyltransferase
LVRRPRPLNACFTGVLGIVEDGFLVDLAGKRSAISFRPLGRSDFPLLRKWLAEEHVRIWWNERFDIASLEAKYGPCIDGSEPVYVYLILHEAVPIGWIQWYRWRDFPEHSVQLGAGYTSAGIDLAIGEIEMTGRGLGPTVIREFGMNYIFTNTDVSAIVADPAASNLHSISAFKKAGFTIARTVQLVGEAFQRHIVRLERIRP